MSSDLTNALRIARAASALLRRNFRRAGVRVHHHKAHEEIVTATDLASNHLITKMLIKYFPKDDIVSEEARMIDNVGKRTWFIDPLDGTTNFAYGYTHYAVCLGLVDAHGQPQLGVIGIPERNEFYFAERGKGAWMATDGIKQKTRLRVSAAPSLTRAMLLFCSGYSPEGQQEFLRVLKRIYPHKPRVRQFASAGIELTALAAGRADAVILTDTKPWDVMAGIVLIREAGGRITDLKGAPWTPRANSLLGSNKKLHPALLKSIK